MSTVLSDEKIPNNVHLSSDKRLQRALEAWQPQFIDWWKQMGPVGWQEKDIYLRTAVSVEAKEVQRAHALRHHRSVAGHSGSQGQTPRR